ncbi:uncharacterized protein MEPE_05332 [Melanopsichium pennsylvanicum]|uniref:Uncharacterized protein n=1 Tax=Melanopsichium pennsylvanicum TaxID=63383 RepID=A0AAJ5C7J0_9BASI|nr:uncharacterized protein MEPE_05332 [Melanopsichium pennsylvanicum]
MAQQLKTQLEHAGLEEESAYYVGRYTISGLQYGCLAATPLYLFQTFRGRGFSLGGLARFNWMIPSLGAAGGSIAGYAAASQLDHSSLIARTNHFRLDAQRVRQDDLHLIGSVLGSLLVPAIFLRRTGLVNGLLGGAGLGGATGMLIHQVQSLTNSNHSITTIQQDAKLAVGKAQEKVQEVKTNLKN